MASKVRGMTEAMDEIRKQVGLLHRTIMFDLDRVIVQKTPRDTGRAEGNWIASINRPFTKTTTTLFRAGNTPTIASIKGPCVSFLSNNLPYITPLNEGHSRQAPAGYIEEAVDQVAAAHL